MQRTKMLALAMSGAALLTVGACGGFNHRTTHVEAAGDVEIAPVTPMNNRTIPTGATVYATLDQALGTNISKAGDAFTATVSNALMAQDGSTVVPSGAKIEGRVTAIDDSDNATEPALIRLAFERIRFNGYSYPFTATIVRSAPVQSGMPSKAETTRKIVIGGAVGAALGGLLSGGDLDKLVIGGAIGAAAGSVVSLGTEMNATLPAGSTMAVRATEPTVLR
jgi:hypothetical protein